MKKFKVVTVCLTLLFSIMVVDVSFAEGTKDTSLSIAASCEGLLISYSRNPSLGEMLQEIHDMHVEQVQMFGEEPDGSTLEAQGIINGAFMLAYARNPSLLETLEAIRDDCLADLGIFPMPMDPEPTDNEEAETGGR